MRTINTLLIAAVLLFATVMVWTYSTVRGTEQSYQPGVGIGGGPGTSDTSATKPDYRKQFEALIPEHGNLAVMHVTMLYDSKNTTETARLLEENTEKLSDVIKSLGTSADRELFYRVFRGHIVDYENYAMAKKANKQTDINNAKENLQMHAMDFGKIIHNVMPSISEEQATKLMNDHALTTLAIIDAHAAGDTAKKLSEISKANTQSEEFAKALTTGAEEATK